jgi:hypothetical protein
MKKKFISCKIIPRSILLVFVSLLATKTPAQSYRAAASNAVASGGLTINKPAGTISGDVMIAAISIRSATSVITAPGGWTLIRRTDNPGSAIPYSQATYWKAAGGSEPVNYAWTFSVSTATAGGICTFYGINTSNPINIENGHVTPAAFSHATQSVTTTMANTMIVTTHNAYAGSTWTPPAGMTESVDATTGSFPFGTSIEMNYVIQASAGATGTKSAACNAGGSGTEGAAQIIALATPIVVPLYFVSVSAERKPGCNGVEWKTTNEVNVKQLEVQRSSANTVFSTIGTMAAHNTPDMQTYNFYDRDLPEGMVYYRIRSLDFDGESKYSKIVSISSHSLNETFVIKNNPVKGNINISLSSTKSALYYYELIDLNGTIVQHGNLPYAGTGSLTIALEPSIEPGSYILITRDEKKLFRQEIIVD